MIVEQAQTSFNAAGTGSPDLRQPRAGAAANAPPIGDPSVVGGAPPFRRPATRSSSRSWAAPATAPVADSNATHSTEESHAE